MTSLSNNQMQFLSFLLSSGALLFGDFTTKSGRKTPYFINTGKLNSGHAISTLGDFYATMRSLGEMLISFLGLPTKEFPSPSPLPHLFSEIIPLRLLFPLIEKKQKSMATKDYLLAQSPLTGIEL